MRKIVVLFGLLLSISISSQWSENRFAENSDYSSNEKIPSPPLEKSDGPGAPEPVNIDLYVHYFLVVTLFFTIYFYREKKRNSSLKLSKLKILENERER